MRRAGAGIPAGALRVPGRTGTGSGSAVGGTSSAENIFEQLVQEKTNIEAFSCKKAYTAAKKCLDKQNYDAAAVWLWIANNAAWEVWEDEGCGKQALQDADEYISRGDDNAAYLLLSYGEEIDGVHYEDDARFDEKLSALQNVQHDKIPDRWKLEEKMYRLEQAKQYGTLSVASVPLRRWEEDGFDRQSRSAGRNGAGADLGGRWTARVADGTWEEIWYGDSVVTITRTDLEGNTIVTEYYEGEPETTEESDALAACISERTIGQICAAFTGMRMRCMCRTPILPHGSLTASHINTGLTSTGSFRLNISTMRTGTECTEELFYKNGEPSYRCVAVYDENGERTGGIRYINAKTGEEFDPDTDGYPD